MKIVVGVKNYAEAEAFIRAGADELYGGLAAVPNHRLPNMSFQEPEELKAAVRLARARGRRFSFLINQPCFGAGYETTLAAVRELDDAGVSACIVRELPMLELLRAQKLRAMLTVSSLALCFNLPAMRRFKQLGAGRVILPFHITPQEAAPLIRNPYGLETEVFFNADFCCVNMDPACRLFSLTKAGQTCRFSYDGPGGRWRMPEPAVPQKLRSDYDFFHCGAPAVKIVRRRDFSESMEAYRFARTLGRLLEKGVSFPDFLRLGSKLYFNVTRNKLTCGKS